MKDALTLQDRRLPDTAKQPLGPPDQPLAKPAARGMRLVGFAALVAVLAALGFGAWRYSSQQRQVMEASNFQRNFVPNVRVAPVRASDGITLVTLPATTLAYAVANIFARATGYIEKRDVDIGDRVSDGQTLVEITAPELDHQIAQAEATLGQNKATVQQTQANLDLARVTWARDKPLVEKGWATPQQGP